MRRHSPPYLIRRRSSLCAKPCRRHRNLSKARSYLRCRGKSSTRIYMSAGRDIIRNMEVQMYRRNEGDRRGRGKAARLLQRKTELATNKCGGSLNCSGQTISPVVTKRSVGFTSWFTIRWRCMNFRADTSCRIKDRATSLVSGST